MSYVITRYSAKNKKVRDPLTIVLAADLHSADTGGHNRGLLCDIRRELPDLIICAGDIVMGNADHSNEEGLHFLESLPGIAPTFLANGNHERRLKTAEKEGKTAYRSLIDRAERSGAVILNNAHADVSLKGTDMRIYGADLPLRLYKKFRKPHIAPENLVRNLGEITDDRLNMLIAHNPEFTDAYFDWGAEMIFSGHYHGGLVRSPFSGRALLSPYGYFFPKYGVGHYEKNEKHAFVSAGLGDHAIPVRIFDPHELVVVKMLPS